jgi:hypothetical protein
MKNQENSPVNEWNGTTAQLSYLTGGPLDSLLAQLAGNGVSPPAVDAPLPEITAASDASEAGTAPSDSLEPTRNR